MGIEDSSGDRDPRAEQIAAARRIRVPGQPATRQIHREPKVT